MHDDGSTLRVLLSCMLLSCARSYSIDDQHADHTAQAIELDEAGDVEGAIASFRAATRFSPNEPAMWTNLGIAVSPDGELESSSAKAARRKACVCFFIALHINPAFEQAHESLEELVTSSAGELSKTTTKMY